MNSTVTCSVSGLSSFASYKGWGGDCSRVEGQNCVIENITNDKHITFYTGTNVGATIQPEGAGNVWCDNQLSAFSLSVDYVSQHCTAEANPGYVFDSFAVSNNALVKASLTKQANTSTVACTNCSSSTLTTDTTTTKTTSKIIEPDALGNVPMGTVAATTNTETGTSSTNITVNSQNTLTGVTTPSNQVAVNVPNSTVKVGNDGTANIVVDSGSNQPVVLNVTSNNVSGVIGTSPSSSNVTLNAMSDLGIQTDVYNFETTNSDDVLFSKPGSPLSRG